MSHWMRRRIERSRERCEKAATLNKSESKAQELKERADGQNTQAGSREDRS
jgi:hypothetical protein